MIPLDKLRALKHGIFHSSCPDGTASALILKDAIPDLRVSFVKYGTEEHRNFPAEPGQVWCDFSPPKERAAEFVAAGALVLDHHTRDVVEPYGELGVFGENERLECGAMLAFKQVWLPLHGFTSSNIADHIFNFAELVAVRDTWKRDDSRFQEALGQGEVLLFWGDKARLAAFLNGDEETIALGEHLLAKKLEAARTAIAESCRFTSGKGTRVLMFQGVAATSDAAELLEKDPSLPFAEHGAVAVEYEFKADLVVGFHYRVDAGRLQLQFSTRSHAGFDCQALARAHGGNGHRAAAGFTVENVGGGLNPYEMFSDLLNEWEAGR